MRYFSGTPHETTSNSSILDPNNEPEIQSELENLKQRWRAKALHGRFYANLHQPDVDISASNTNLTSRELFSQTEGTFLAIQDQVVPTRT